MQKDIEQEALTEVNENEGMGKGRVLIALFISILLYGSFFYNLVRQQLNTLLQKQQALESINIIAVPGTGFLNSIGSSGIFKSSLFY
ncbi:unnamed protein product, partial [marine sediment metagenome]